MSEQERKPSPWVLVRVELVGFLADVEEARRVLVGKLVIVQEGLKGWLGRVREVTDDGEVRMDWVRDGALFPGPMIPLRRASRVLQLVCDQEHRLWRVDR